MQINLPSAIVWARLVHHIEKTNYRSAVVAKRFFWMVFCLTLYCSVLRRWIGEMYEDEHLNFKNRHCACVTSASPQPRVKKKNPNLVLRASSSFRMAVGETLAKAAEILHELWRILSRDTR